MENSERPWIRCTKCGHVMRLDEAHVHQLAAPLLDSWRAEIRLEETAAAQASCERDLEDERVKRGELEATVKEQRAREVNLLREQRKLETDKAGLELEKERMRGEIRKQERTVAEEHARQLFEEKQREKDADHEEEIEVLKRTHELQLQRVKADDEALKRKADSGTRQQEGIARQDLYGEEMHKRFPDDKITVTVPGKWGWDVTEDVCLGTLSCGTISHECKRTARWNPE